VLWKPREEDRRQMYIGAGQVDVCSLVIKGIPQRDLRDGSSKPEGVEGMVTAARASSIFRTAAPRGFIA
jgi:hypothetical protein